MPDTEETTETVTNEKPPIQRFEVVYAQLKAAEKRATKAEAALGAANSRYEAAEERAATQATEHAAALATLESEGAIGSALAAAGIAADDDAAAYARFKYGALEASVADDAPEGTKPTKPTFGEWLTSERDAKPAYLSRYASKPETKPAPKGNGAVKAHTAPAEKPGERVAAKSNGTAPDYTPQAFQAMSPEDRRTVLEGMNLMEPKEA